MARLIDADRALEIVSEQGIAHPNAYHLTTYATLILREAPTVDAVEVVHGQWETKGYVCGESEFECSVCHETEWRTSISRFRWCPFCGARMDGAE